MMMMLNDDGTELCTQAELLSVVPGGSNANFCYFPVNDDDSE
jgi:hypothetical protein